MEISVHGAWEIICGLVSVRVGEIINTEPFVDNKVLIGENPTYVTLHTKGIITFENIKTGEKKTFREGDFYPFDDSLSPGEYKLLFDEDIEHLCISPFTADNVKYHPLKEKISPFKLMNGNSIIIEQDKRLFLVKGHIIIGEKHFKDINRIKFHSEDKLVVAQEDSYGFFINS
jgi:hypothetical protein